MRSSGALSQSPRSRRVTRHTAWSAPPAGMYMGSRACPSGQQSHAIEPGGGGAALRAQQPRAHSDIPQAAADTPSAQLGNSNHSEHPLHSKLHPGAWQPRASARMSGAARCDPSGRFCHTVAVEATPPLVVARLNTVPTGQEGEPTLIAKKELIRIYIIIFF